MAHFDPDDLRRLIAGEEPEELRHSYLAIPSAGPYMAGSTVRPLGGLRGTQSGLVVPADSVIGPSPIDYVGVYLTLEDYWPYDTPAGPMDPETVVDVVRSMSDETTFLVGLAWLNLLLHNREELPKLAAEYVGCLTDERGPRLLGLLQHGGTDQRHFLARQPILFALREVIQKGAAAAPVEDPLLFPPAILLAHAVATQISAEPSNDEAIGGAPAHLFFELLRIAVLGDEDDMWSSIDRVVRLWRDYGSRIEKEVPRAAPADLLVEATGLEVEEFLGLGFAVYSQVAQFQPSGPRLLRRDLGLESFPEEKLQAFRNLTVAPLDHFRDAFAGRSSRFDFFPLQERPLLELKDGLLPLDMGYLWDRVTSGLFHFVHAHEEQLGGNQNLAWRRAYGEAVEMMVEDELAAIAPTMLDGSSLTYNEHDIERAYGETKKCDYAIDFGETFLLVEIVSGALSLPTTIDGLREQFVKDTERLVIKKCRQLDAAASAILTTTKPLTGFEPVPGLRALPVVVVGGGYPLNPYTVAYIEECLVNEALLADPRIEPLCVIDLAEVEQLEAIAERGQSVPEVLRSWKASGLASVPLRNFLLRSWSGREMRPTRMRASVDATFERIVGMFQPPEGTAGP